jgi:Uri superfamily endonuclease
MNVNAFLDTGTGCHSDSRALANRWPQTPGTYALVLEATRSEEILVGGLGLCRFPPGYYVYVGSALGPGGLRARLARHLRSDKRSHWHIDFLAGRLPVVRVFAWPSVQRRECEYVQRLLAWAGAIAAVPGFGSSDCHQGCPAHLILLPGGFDSTSIAGIARHLTP